MPSISSSVRREVWAMPNVQGRGFPREQIERLVEIVSRSEFTDLIAEIENASEEDRAEVAQSLANVVAFRERGIPVPEGLRVTTRVFENPDDPRTITTSIVDDRSPAARRPPADEVRGALCASVGVVVCASYGEEVAI
jgi:hypothetical protein